MASTINTSNIDTTYPIAGQDNDSQGFRDNFTNINTNFASAKTEIEDLQGKVILKSALTGTTLDNDMAGALITAAQIQGFRGTVKNIASVAAAAEINVSEGPYQQITPTESTTLSFTNWSPSGTHSAVQVEITITDVLFTVTLPGTVTLGTDGLLGFDGTKITFASLGTFIFEFSTVTAGGTIAITDVTRGRSLNLVDDLTPQLGGSLDVNGNSIVSITNGDIIIAPGGTGDLILDGLSWPQSDGGIGYFLQTNGSGQLSWSASAGISNIIEDSSPQLGGTLDVNGNSIVSITNGNIAITPDGIGSIVLDGLNWPQADGTASYFLQTDGSGQLSWSAAGGLLNVVEDLTPQLGGTLDVNGFSIITTDAIEAAVSPILITGGNESGTTGQYAGHVTLQGGNASPGTAGSVNLYAGSTTSGSYYAGNVRVYGGDAASNKGGGIIIKSGDALSANSNFDSGLIFITTPSPTAGGSGGNINLTTGNGSGPYGDGGTINITAGNSALYFGGDVNISAGSGGTGYFGGHVNITAGTSNAGYVGDIVLTAGAGGVAGEGAVEIKNANSAISGRVHIYESSANGTNKVQLLAPVTLAADTNFVFPPTDGANGEVLSTDGSGVTSWIAAGGSNNWLTANNGSDFSVAPTAAFLNAITIGNGASSGYRDSIAIGTSANALGRSVSIGEGSSGTGSYCVAIGKAAQANSSTTTVVGYNAVANGNSGISLGPNTISSGSNSIVIGNGSSAALNNSIAIGSDTDVVLVNQTAIGYRCDAGVVTTDVAYSVKIGAGNPFASTDKNMLHLFSKGKLELYGDEAQYILPNYATGSIPATTNEGGAVWDSTTKELKIYNGTAFTAIGGGGASNNWISANVGVDFATAPSSISTNSIVIGDNAFAGNGVLEIEGIAIGKDAGAGRAYSIAIGSNAGLFTGAPTTNSASIAIGQNAQTTGAFDIVVGRNSSSEAGSSNVAIGNTARAYGTAVDSIVMGRESLSNKSTQIAIGRACNVASVTTDVEYSVKIGAGTPTLATDKNMLHLFSKGKLELYGDEAQYILPDYATGSLPAGVEGGIAYDSSTSSAKLFDGTNWGDIAGNDTAGSYGTTGAISLNTANDTYFYPTATTTGVITFTFTGAAISGRVTTFTLEMLGAGTNAPVWPASVDWPGGTEPTWTAGVDVVRFTTRDNGTTWLGVLDGTNFS